MDVAESAPREAAPADQVETFCGYLARQLVARQGFKPGAPAEAREIAEQSDHALICTDRYSPVVVALIDREAHPGKAFTLPPERVRAIALAGRVGIAKVPGTIHPIEVGATPDQPARLGDISPRLLDGNVAAWAIDPQRATIWTTAGWRGRSLRNFIEKLLESPRETVVAPTPVATLPRSFPWLTAAIIVVLAAIFATEVAFGVSETDRLMQLTTTTWVAFGGLMGKLVTGSGEWYRLFTAPLLHGGLEHVALNASAIGLAGYVLEPLIGRAWFAALFVLGALCGALFSLAFNPLDAVAVGASGAATALFACMLVLSRRFPKGAARRRLQTNAIFVLLPSLLPLAATLQGMKIDYAAHFGGAFVGVAAGLVLLARWPAGDVRPRLRTVATAIAFVGLAGFVGAGALAQRDYPVWAVQAAFAPQEVLPATEAAWRQQAAGLVARYPRDPRMRFIHALALIETGDRPGAERALRTGLAEEALWQRTVVGRDLARSMHAALALILVEGNRRDEAREAAKSGCLLGAGNQFRAALDEKRLCAN